MKLVTTTFTTTFLKGGRHAEKTQTLLSAGQARVRIDGKDNYLGEYRSPESYERYEELIADWFRTAKDVDRVGLTIDELCIVFVDFVKQYYRHQNGSPTGTLHSIRSALRHLVATHGHLVFVSSDR